MENIDEELKKIIGGIIEQEPDKIDADARFVEDLGMDSMMAIEMVAAMEKKYKIEIPDEYLSEFTTINRVVDLAKKILSKKNKRDQ